jgi:hypothetical protein
VVDNKGCRGGARGVTRLQQISVNEGCVWLLLLHCRRVKHASGDDGQHS